MADNQNIFVELTPFFQFHECNDNAKFKNIDGKHYIKGDFSAIADKFFKLF